MFQFRKGAIKSMRIGVVKGISRKFQFRKGAIKRPLKDNIYSPLFQAAIKNSIGEKGGF